jgi:hypothetical protein
MLIEDPIQSLPVIVHLSNIPFETLNNCVARIITGKSLHKGIYHRRRAWLLSSFGLP